MVLISILLINILTFIASFLGTISGFGLGTIMTPILLSFYNYGSVILFVAIIHWFHNVQRIGLFYNHINWRISLLCGIPSIVGAFIGGMLITSFSSLLLFLFACFLFFYSVWLMIYPQFSLPDNMSTVISGGFITGLMAGIFGVRGAVRSSFLVLFDLSKKSFIATTAVIGLMTDTSRLIAYWFQGIELTPLFRNTLIFVIIFSFLGAWSGQKVINKIPQEQFRKVVSLFLVFASLLLMAEFLYKL